MNPTKKPFVLVLILSYNGKHLLDECISSYLSNSYDNFKIVVIDNGSTDGTKDYVNQNFGKTEVLRLEKNQGYSGGFNHGLLYAFQEKMADFVLVTNNDVKADGKLIEELVHAALINDHVGFVTGKVYYYDNPSVLQTVGKSLHPIWWNGGHIGEGEKDIGQYDEIRELPFADDIYTLVSKELYAKTSGYDTTFFLQSEEYDWQARAKKIGFKIYYTPYAKLWHKESMTIGKVSPQKEYYNARNSMLVVLFHREPSFFQRFFWKYFFYKICYKSAKSFGSFKFKKALFIWLGFFSGLECGIRRKKITLQHIFRY